MRFPARVLGACVLSLVFLASTTRPLANGRAITWADAAPIRPQLEQHGISGATFAARVQQIRERNARRVREGDLDHLVFYLLQSTRFTTLPPIEPALSAKAYVDSGRVPDSVRARVAAFVEALDSSTSDARFAFFRELVATVIRDRQARPDSLLQEYERAMRFLYEKEFVAQRSKRPADAVGELYRSRGLSTDTAVEAGYLVYQGLGVLKSLEPTRRIRRVLIVGPGLDLAPRTGMLEQAPPESYQPWAVIDALLGLGVSDADDLEVAAADINPRVVEHLRRARSHAPVLTLVPGIQANADVRFSDEYREYFAGLGKAIGTVEGVGDGGMRKRVRVRDGIARLLRPERLDIVTERMDARAFDVIIATNILPYFDDLELTLAMSNVAAMLAPGGVFLHNEPRLSLGEITNAVGLPFDQLRRATIATVANRPPLVDTVFLHKKVANQLPASGFQLPASG